MTTAEADALPAPQSGDTFAFPPLSFPDNPSTGSTSPPAPQYCIYPPAITFPPYSEAPPPPPFYFTPVIPINPPPAATIPNPPTIYVPNPPNIYVPNPPVVPSPPTGYIPNPPETGPSPPSSSFPPVFQPPVLYPPPSAPPPPGPSAGIWCVAKPSVPAPIIQEAMDYACGSGADCQSIQEAGPCFSPDTLLNHASYAFNSFYQRTKAAGGTCDFGGTAMIVTTDPSYDGCHFLYNQGIY
ncbi:unnamed protein product [Victoria cruziana]